MYEASVFLTTSALEKKHRTRIKKYR